MFMTETNGVHPNPVHRISYFEGLSSITDYSKQDDVTIAHIKTHACAKPYIQLLTRAVLQIKFQPQYFVFSACVSLHHNHCPANTVS